RDPAEHVRAEKRANRQEDDRRRERWRQAECRSRPQQRKQPGQRRGRCRDAEAAIDGIRPTEFTAADIRGHLPHGAVPPASSAWTSVSSAGAGTIIGPASVRATRPASRPFSPNTHTPGVRPGPTDAGTSGCDQRGSMTLSARPMNVGWMVGPTGVLSMAATYEKLGNVRTEADSVSGAAVVATTRTSIISREGSWAATSIVMSGALWGVKPSGT